MSDVSTKMRAQLEVSQAKLFGGAKNDLSREVTRDALLLIIAEGIVELVEWQESINE